MNRTRLTRRGVLMLAAAGATGGIAASARAQEEHGEGRPAGAAAQAMGVDTRRRVPHTPEQEALAKEIGWDLVCLCETCPKRPITDCECGWAQQNQTALINAVAKGMTREEIVATYRRVYGDAVLAMLPIEGVGRAVWIAPYALGLVGLGAAFWIGARYLKRTQEAHAEPAAPAVAQKKIDDSTARAELQKELEDLD